MKKVLFGIVFLMMMTIAQPAMAKSTEVEALSSFDSTHPPRVFNCKVLADSELPDGTILKEGFEVYSDINEVKDPKRLKQNATFSLKPQYYIDNNGAKHNFDHEVFARYTTVLDKGQLAKSAALGVGNYFVKGLSTGVAAVEGAVKNEEGNRAKSTVVSVYKASPLSYVEKGQDLQINAGDEILLKFTMPDYVDPEDAPNYEYTELVEKQMN